MLTWITALALAQELPELEAKPDPVLEYAQLDLRTTRKARVGLVLASAGAPVAIAGFVGAFTYQNRTTTAGRGLSVGMAGVGTVAFVAGPPLLASHSLRARKALRTQGLRVTPLPGLLSWAMYGSAFVVAASSPNPAGWATSGGLYAGSVVVGAVQLYENRRARKEAGWLGATHTVPWTDGRAVGVAFVPVR